MITPNQTSSPTEDSFQTITISSNSLQFLGRVAGPLVIMVASLAMLFWNWRGWPDPLVDFGQQLYLAWQLAEGKVLYSDIAYHHGALSPYLNSVWFRLFGVSFLTLSICNIIITLCFTLLLFRMLVEVSNRFAATIACLTFVGVFAYGQLVGYGNYNFVSPYVHSVTHGTMIAFFGIYTLWLAEGSKKLFWTAMAGAALGLVFLTKAEVFLAAAPALVVGLTLSLGFNRVAISSAVIRIVVFAGCGILPPLIAFLLLWSAMPASEALRGALGPWPSVLQSEASQLKFYRWGMGLLDAEENLKKMVAWMGWYALVFIPAGGISIFLRKPGRYRQILSAISFVGLVVLFASRETYWPDAVRILPIAMVLLGVVLFAKRVRDSGGAQYMARLILQITLVVFAMALLAKMILNVRTYHYGFALAMPASLLLVVALIGWLPAYIDRCGGYGKLFCSVALAAWGVAMYGHLDISRFWFSQKSFTVSAGTDAFQADMRGKAVNLIVKDINQRVGANETLAVIPEGVMINYLSRRVNPTPYNYFMPTDLMIYGEEKMLEAFQARPPDYVCLVHKDTSGFGFTFFGQDYGQTLYSWIQKNYRRVKLVGRPPLKDQRFGIALLKRVNAG